MKSTICLWNDLTLADTRALSNCKIPQDIKSFAKEHSFNEEQTSSFFSIVKRTHEKAIETSFGNLEETFSYFKELIACHSAKRPPFCVHLFQVHEIKAITDYVFKTYFRHFKLYKYAFTPKIIMNVAISYQGVSENAVEDPDEVNPDITVDEDQTDITDGEEKDPVEDEDPPAVRELKKIIESTLEEQINKLKLSVDQKLKVNEEMILKTANIGNKKGTIPSKGKGKRR